jgi:hypothetical protein
VEEELGCLGLPRAGAAREDEVGGVPGRVDAPEGGLGLLEQVGHGVVVAHASVVPDDDDEEQAAAAAAMLVMREDQAKQWGETVPCLRWKGL